MRALLICLIMTFGTQAAAASTTLRYWDGSYASQISGLEGVSECERLAKQKRLKSNHFYCIESGKPFDRNFERKNNWK